MAKHKQPSVLSHIVSILVLPFNVTIIIPLILLYFFPNSLGWGQGVIFSSVVYILGVLLILIGLILVILTVNQFAKR
ncbi:hypothetical protein [Alkalibacillus aidingensis]|uniref:hypothetical protein n=1 Tax=Alkalibacillus aidingensis TaxID=2747607 RepID=UPI0016612BF5|nr:hypothetical protein [Alkalibacillus aidingensis]